MAGHLRRRQGIYWFRRRVPGALVRRLGRREVQRSLKTASPREAAVRAKSAWLATEGAFTEMIRDPQMVAAQAKLLIDRLLREPFLASPTTDEMVDSMVNSDSSYARMLFNEVAADILMLMEPEERTNVAAQMNRIFDRTDLAVARQARDQQKFKDGEPAAAQRRRQPRATHARGGRRTWCYTGALFDQGLVQVLQAAATGLQPKQPYVLALADNAAGTGTLQPLAVFMSNPADAAVVNAVAPIRQLVQADAGATRRYLMIAPGTAAQPGKPVQVQD